MGIPNKISCALLRWICEINPTDEVKGKKSCAQDNFAKITKSISDSSLNSNDANLTQEKKKSSVKQGGEFGLRSARNILGNHPSRLRPVSPSGVPGLKCAAKCCPPSLAKLTHNFHSTSCAVCRLM